jgi:CheY-like chemotaxis protein
MEDTDDARPTVLVVEDFEDNRFMMRRLLEMSGYRVVEAVNGNQAVESAASVRPDIILMDLSLPQLDGLAATRRIRSQEDSRKVPIDFDQLVQLLDRLTKK